RVWPDRSTTSASGGGSIASANRWMRPSTTSTCCGTAWSEIPSHTAAPAISVAAIVPTSRVLGRLEPVAQDPCLAPARLELPGYLGSQANPAREQIDLGRMRQAGLFDQRQLRIPGFGHSRVFEPEIPPLDADITEHLLRRQLHRSSAKPADASVVV